jgi:hypothetical protein
VKNKPHSQTAKLDDENYPKSGVEKQGGDGF